MNIDAQLGKKTGFNNVFTLTGSHAMIVPFIPWSDSTYPNQM